MSARAEAKTFLTLNGSQWRRELKRSRADMKNFAAGAANDLKKVAAAATAVVAASAVIGSQYQRQMTVVRGVSNATEKEIQKLGAAARKMGSETDRSATEAAGGLENLLRAGLGVEGSISSLEGTLKLAGAGQRDMAFTAELVAGSLKTYGKDAKDTDEVVNLLFASTTKTRLDLDRLNSAIANGGPTAAAWNISMAESIATMGKLTDVLGDGGRAGTFYKAVVTELEDAARHSSGTIGKALEGWNIKTDGMTDAIRRLELAGIKESDALQNLGLRAGPGLAILLKTGSKAIEQLEADITGTNSAFDAYNLTLDDTQGLFAIMRSTIEEAALRIFEVTQGPINEAIEGITKLVSDNFEAISAATESVVVVLTDVGEVIVEVAKLAEENKGAVLGMATGFVIAKGAIAAASVAMAVFDALAIANPIGIIVVSAVALGGAIGVIVDKTIGWDTATRIIKAMWDGLKNEVMLVANAISIVADRTTTATRKAHELKRAWKEYGEERARVLRELEGTNGSSGEYDNTLPYGGRIPGADVPLSGPIPKPDPAVEDAKKDPAADPKVQAVLAREVAIRGHIGMTHAIDKLERDLEHGEYVKSYEAKVAEHQKWANRTTKATSAAFAHIRKETAKVTSFEILQKLKLGKVLAGAARAAAAVEIESLGEVAQVRAGIQIAAAAAAYARYDFAAGLKHTAAAALYTAGAMAAGIAASVVRGADNQVQDRREEEFADDATGTTSGSGRRTMDLTQRHAPENVFITVNTTVQGSIFGDDGFDALVDRYLFPRLRAAMEGNVL